MLEQCRQQIVTALWEYYRSCTPQVSLIQEALQCAGMPNIYLDHFAVIDLPSAQSGIPILKQIFMLLGYQPKGKGYLASKQNEFHWLADPNPKKNPKLTIPQVVVADFNLADMPSDIQTIIKHYASQTQAFDFSNLKRLIQQVNKGYIVATQQLKNLILGYFKGRDWPLPTVAEFKKVHAFNELLAWVLVFGRRPNHFTLSIHLLKKFVNLETFHQFLQPLALAMNQDGGVIKGGQAVGMAQSSTNGDMEMVALADGNAALPLGFVEFVWRYAKNPEKPVKVWEDYYTDFIANHADFVIQSLYQPS